MSYRIKGKIMNNRNELERFKTDINIADVAVVMGFEIDKRKSSRKSIVLKSGGDVIVVSRNTNGHYVYFNPNDSRDNGTIIDFIQKRTGKNLGQVRKFLRQFLGKNTQHLKSSIQSDVILDYNNTKNVERIIEKFEAEWQKIKKSDIKKELPYDFRYINYKTINECKNIALVDETDGKSYYIFHVFTDKGVSGLYKINANDNGKTKLFEKGSIKGVWVDKKVNKNINEIIITESPIDSLSALELGKKGDDILHIATLGRMGREAKETLRKIFDYLPNAKILIATDQDKAGEEIAEQIVNLAKDNEIYRLNFEGKDLNETLQIKKYQAKQQKQKHKINRGWGLMR
jgi:5S rRNA maturation endonuclease (ribonuclease M5)